MADRFRDNVALITGAASGIGRALAEALAQRGAVCILADVSADGCAAVAEALRAGGALAEAHRLDVTDAAAFEALVEDVWTRHGRIDLLFNNAGVGLAGAVRDLTLADWKRALDVNVWGVIHGVQAAYPRMVARRAGHIVNTASGAGLLPRPGMVPYAAAKHAVVGLSTSLRAEAAPHGVRVSVVCPGFVDTNIQRATRYVALDAERLTARIPFRPISAEGCARVVLRGVRRNRAIIPVTKLVWVEWWLNRLSPRLGLWLVGLRTRAFERARTAGRS